MSNAPKIAVVVPIYNTESYLKECIESITNQTYKNITIFCIDDGSTDKSRDVIKKKLKKKILEFICEQLKILASQQHGTPL